MTVKKNKNDKKTYRLLISILFGVALFGLVKPTFVNVMAKEEDLSLFLANGNVEVEIKKGKNGFSQIKYRYNSRDIDLTESDVTNADPDTDGEYIAWMAQIEGYWQILLHYLPSGQTIQLSGGENNVNPSVSGNMVVWEGQINGVWQAFLFDGIRTIQLTEGLDPVQDVGIDTGTVVFSQKAPSGEGWNVFMYTIEDGKLTLLTKDTYGRGVTIENGLIAWFELDGEEYVAKSLSLAVSQSSSEEEAVLSSENTPEEVKETTEEGVESTESVSIVEDNDPVEIIEIILKEEAEIPEEVTEEDIEAELGLERGEGVEDETEEIIDSIQEETEQVIESTESTGSEVLEN